MKNLNKFAIINIDDMGDDNMKNISSFFEFPGILIIIGVAFILCAIIISLVTKRKNDDTKEMQTVKEKEEQEDNYYFEPVKLIDDEDVKQVNNEPNTVKQEDDLFKELELTKEQQNTNDDVESL